MIGDIMNNHFKNLLKEAGLDITNRQLEQFETYFKLLVEWNEKLNLTAITDLEGVYVKHFYDSVSLVQAMEINDQTLLDVGSGAGFPSIPLKIMFPNLKVTIIDALQKRIKFLEVLVKELDLDVTLIHGRAEEFKKKHCFDVVTGRAVANLTMLSELCIPFVKVGGYFLSMKGSKALEEMKQAEAAVKLLGAEFETHFKYELMDQERYILKYKKVFKTKPKYPRRFNQIKSNPL